MTFNQRCQSLFCEESSLPDESKIVGEMPHTCKTAWQQLSRFSNKFPTAGHPSELFIQTF